MKLALCFLLWMTVGNAQNVNVQCKPWRLPRNILPSHYELTIKVPNESTNLQFRGSVKIDMNCTHETDTITLHSQYLSIVHKSITVEPSMEPGKIFRVVNLIENNKYQMIHIQLEFILRKGSSYVLNIPEFSGKIHDYEERGLFKSCESNGDKIREAYCTFFQPTYARMVFPCFDEPNMKATFTVKTERPAHLNSYSNMPISSTVQMSHDRYLDIFERSPLMSTYLLAISINDFPSYRKNESVRTNILLAEDKDDRIDLSVTYEVASHTLMAMEEYTNIPYKLGKLDHVMMADYEFLGMEHWGLIVYKRKVFRQGTETAVGKQEMLSLIIHEVAHQWFGNLVTMEWWSYIWLNEAFANYFQYAIGNKILPEWRFTDVFIIVDYQNALEYDDQSKGPPAFPLTNKIICDIGKNYYILTEPAYSKGSSVLRMFQSILGGEEYFKTALRIYLNNRMMATAKPADLFHALDNVNSQFKGSHLPNNVTFEHVGLSWTTQAGVPLVTVIRDYNSGAAHFTQERFYLNPKGKKQDPRWWIPITWTTASAPDNQPLDGPQDWFYEDKTIQLNIGANDWLLLNSNVTGYYRVNYDDENWSLLAEGLKRSAQKFSTANRVQILNDAVALVLAKRLDIEIAFNITQFLMNEDDPIVWISAEKNLNRLLNSDQISQYSFYAYYKKKIYIHQLMTKAYSLASGNKKYTSFKTPLHQIMRESVENFACELLVISCYRDRYSSWIYSFIRALI